MNNKPKVTNIVHANLFSRFFASLLDLVMVILVAAGAYILTNTIAAKSPQVVSYHDTFVSNVTESGLMSYDEKTNKFDFIHYETYEENVNLMYTFYHDFYSNKVDDGITRDVYWFNVFVLGQKDDLNKYSNKGLTVQSYIKEYGQELFTYHLDSSGEAIYDSFALPKIMLNGEKTFDELSDSEKTKINQYFFKDDEIRNSLELDNTWRDFALYFALSDLTSLKVVKDAYDKYALYSSTLPLYICITATTIIFFAIIPLIFKNGETLGKLIMHVCLVNSEGYQHRRPQIILRYGPTILLVVVVELIFGISIISVGLLSLVVLASYLCAIFTKEHKAFHDYIAGTLVVDKKASTWFKNAEEEANAQKEVNDFVVGNQEENATN